MDDRAAGLLNADLGLGRAQSHGHTHLDPRAQGPDCEPLRASGKVLIADKVLVLAGTVGEARFASDAAWARAFAHATVAALGRPVVQVNVAAGTLSY